MKNLTILKYKKINFKKKNNNKIIKFFFNFNLNLLEYFLKKKKIEIFVAYIIYIFIL
jgi:hypothetical protein